MQSELQGRAPVGTSIIANNESKKVFKDALETWRCSADKTKEVKII